jgi:tetratricopeptide (TPR) repeat protein
MAVDEPSQPHDRAGAAQSTTSGDTYMTETRSSEREAERKGRPWLLIAAVGVVLVAAVVAVLVFVFRDGDSDSKSSAKSINATLNAGLAAQAKGDLAEARKQYEKVLTMDSKNKYALYDLAVIDYGQSNVGLAEQRYLKVLQIDAKYEPALYNLAVLYQAKGDTNKALPFYQRAVQANPNDPNAHFNLALILRAIHYKADGDAQMKIALRLNPKLKDPAAKASAKPKPAKTTPAATSSS